jgi:hypothetical protein
VPPPMCSVKLCLYPHDDRELPRAPVDVALASHRDLLAVLDVNNAVAIWDLSDSIMAGPRNGTLPSTPKLVWEGDLSAASDPSQGGTGKALAARQIVVWRFTSAVESDWSAAVLASDPQTNEDIIHLIGETITQPTTVRTSTTNGRLFVSTDNLWIQSTTGEIFFGRENSDGYKFKLCSHAHMLNVQNS